ncbi:MAG: hypothetical protein LBS88_01305 [Tannerellaceae bacterium]|jgi:hypothetical protein|nr:hypothetical protein [Tannerellaceae bacterium]
MDSNQSTGIMDIDDLVRKYFEGETTGEEEKRLRAFFASDRVPEHLAFCKPVFAYFDEEIRKKQQKKTKTGLVWRKIYYYPLSGIVAAVLLLLGISRTVLRTEEDACLCSENYVVINGRCYTDIQKARSLAFEALQEVATPADAYFPGSSMFNDEE